MKSCGDQRESVWPTREQPFDQLSETMISAINPGPAQQVEADLAQHLPALNLTLAEQTLLQLTLNDAGFLVS